ncbi:hypothetical protein [Paraburkholderia tagetis]|uniref:Beta-barrel assembly machine subunit BamE n=1 Tax=Paraburkholderia tagetis TaxID=2913261 RepID=A0A9X1RLN4_9BURK|nr:hypothetical protein [Paraburkholderia tagetis]MCG5073798.1 hypothetical protein [Paraburkholderia tagetis]
MNKLLYATLVASLLGVSACSSPTPTPDVAMSYVTQGMTQTDVVKRIGPPDRVLGENGNECFQYALGKYGNVPFAVYFKQRGVAATARAKCDLAQVRAAAGPAVTYHSSEYAVTRR